MQLSDLRQKFASPHAARCRRRSWTTPRSRAGSRALPSAALRQWGASACVVLLLGVGLTVLLAAFTHAALLGIPVIVAGILLHVRRATGCRSAPPRATAVLRRVERVPALHRRVGEGAGALRRAEEPLLGVPAVRDRVRRDREVGARRSRASTTSRPTRRRGTSSSHAFTYLAFSSAIDGFTVTTSGTLTSTPPSTSGSSGFSGSGGGFSGGGGGGGGGGSW